MQIQPHSAGNEQIDVGEPPLPRSSHLPQGPIPQDTPGPRFLAG